MTSVAPFPIPRAMSGADWAGPVAVGGAGIAMLWWTWGTWPDVLIDFGRELYLPWQITEGKVLYRDLASFNGPLSPYVNAVWFLIFGVSLRSLVIGNIAIAGALLAMLYRLLSEMGGRRSAIVGGIVFVTVFGCAQLRAVGNYNFICPYAHELTHGVTLSVAGIWCLWRYASRRQLLAIVGSGLCLALTLLTKIEVAGAYATTLLVGLPLIIWMERSGRRRWQIVALVALAAAVPLVVFAGVLTVTMPWRQALGGVFESWRGLIDPEVRRGLGSLPFYQAVTVGLDPVASLKTIALWTIGYATVLVPAYFLARKARTFDGLPTVIAVFGVLVATRYWGNAARALPLFMLLWIARLLYIFWVTPDAARTPAFVLRMTWATFGFALLAKTILNASFGHYGFALAMPATLGFVAELMDRIPTDIQQRGGSPRSFRGAATTLVVAMVAVNLLITTRFVQQKNVKVGRGGDAFWADSRGLIVNQALDDLMRRVRADQTLVALPEGVMLNYLARRPSSTPFINFMPPEVLIFGEPTMVAALRAEPPDYVVVVHKDTSEYGVRFFGRDYGVGLASWMADAYQPVAVFGARPLQDERFGIELLRRE